MTIAFLVAALVLIGSEFVAPTLLTGFLGAAALVAAGLRAVGLVEGIPASLLVWAVSSLGLAIPLRPLARRLLLTGEQVRDPSDADRDAYALVVDVIADVNDETDDGRIRHEGTLWHARTTSGRVKKGEKARLLVRDGLVWVVEPAVAEPAQLAADGFRSAAVADRRPVSDPLADPLSDPLADPLAVHKKES